ncbi:MAG: T9SS type A sorting domain-containing protein [Bacteroidetes bacterium]|nr:T9SS type A sorting domain-containing protein [Bacteroidota bacterium]
MDKTAMMKTTNSIIRKLSQIGIALLVFSMVITVQAQNCVQAPANMVSWWDADDVTGTVAADIQDNNDGTLQNGATTAPGMVGQAFSFDGVDDFVLVPDNANLDIVGDVTVDLWAKRTGFGVVNILISKGAGFTPIDEPTVFLLRFVNNRLQAVFEPAITSLNVVLNGPLVTDSNFHFYAYVRSGNTHTLYMDGNIVASGGFNLPPASTVGLPLTIGAQNHDPFNTSPVPGFLGFFEGLIDEVEIFDRALSQSELLSIYNAAGAGKCKSNDDCSNFTCGAQNNKVVVCHVPPGNPNNEHEICISPNALQAHLAHGDYCGPCNSSSKVGSQQSVSVYPNHVIRSFVIELNQKILSENENIEMSIYDLLGRTMKPIESLNSERIEIDISDWDSGLYIYVIRGDKGIIETGKFMKE